MSNPYRSKVTHVSFVLSLFVMGIHAYDVYAYNLTGGLLLHVENLLNGVFSVAVPLFFALSGYLFCQNLNDANLVAKWRSRLFGLVIPYLIWNALAFLYFETLNTIPFVASRINGDIEPFTLGNLILSTLIGNHNILWFLRNLILFTYGFSLLYAIFRRFRASAPLLMAICLLCQHMFPQLQVDGWSVLNGSPYYLFGCFMALHFKDAVQVSYSRKVMVSALITFVVLVLLPFASHIFNSDYVLETRLLLMLISFWVAFGLMGFPEEVRDFEKLSFFIYVCHEPVMEAVQRLIHMVLGDTTIGAAINYFATPAIVFGIVLAMSSILRRMPRLWGVLTGKRG